jgi:hypothetical protein
MPELQNRCICHLVHDSHHRPFIVPASPRHRRTNEKSLGSSTPFDWLGDLRNAPKDWADGRLGTVAVPLRSIG